MKTSFLRVYSMTRHHLPELSAGKNFTARQLLEAFKKRTGQAMTLRTLQWYGTVGLIEKPAKKGRQASYLPHVLDELWGAKVLQIDYKLTVEGLLKLRKNKVSPFVAAYCLSRIRDRYLQRCSTPKISSLLTRIGHKFKELDRQIMGFWDEPVSVTVSRTDWQEMWTELSQRAGIQSLGGQIDKDLRQITEEFLYLIIEEGSDPRKIDLYRDELKRQDFPED
jgi:hypothetical protein